MQVFYYFYFLAEFFPRITYLDPDPPDENSIIAQCLPADLSSTRYLRLPVDRQGKLRGYRYWVPKVMHRPPVIKNSKFIII